jgi:hypothetical protein
MQERPRDPGERQGREPGETRRGPSYSSQDVRQGEIILRTRRRRWIFFGGLVACVVLALLAATLSP